MGFVDELTAGTDLDGKYRITRELGRGGMGVVFAASSLADGSPVALKLLLEPSRDTMLERFAREAEVVGQLVSPHVCRVLDVGAFDAGRVPYIAMELLEGTDLDDMQRNRGRIPWQEAVDYVVQALDALGEAHLRGIVHRDLKPANLFLVTAGPETGRLKVLDFGISKVRGSSKLTGTRDVLGSPGYMAPEQLKHTAGVDARADLWGLGTILYQLVSGEEPFEATTLPEVLVRVLNDEPTSLGILCGDLPPGLRQVIERCLQKDPAARFQSAAQLAAALQPFATPAVQPIVSRLRSAFEATERSATGTPQVVVQPGIGGAASAASPTVPEGPGPTQVAPAWPSAAGPAPLPAHHGPLVHGAAAPAPKRWPWAVGAMIILLGAAAGVGLWLLPSMGRSSRDDDSEEASTSRSGRQRGKKRKTKKKRTKPGVKGATAKLPIDVPGLPKRGRAMFGNASAFFDDAAERHGSRARLYTFVVMSNGMATLRLEIPDQPLKVKLYGYNAGQLVATYTEDVDAAAGTFFEFPKPKRVNGAARRAWKRSPELGPDREVVNLMINSAGGELRYGVQLKGGGRTKSLFLDRGGRTSHETY